MLSWRFELIIPYFSVFSLCEFGHFAPWNKKERVIEKTL